VSGLAAALLTQADRLAPILAEIEQMKLAYRAELRDDNPDQNTLLAIKNRLRALDSASTSRMVIR
jgi:hypothetical protein